MPILALDTHVASDLKKGLVFADGKRPLPRVNLRKRPHSAKKATANLPAVNSAFLSGLFADVAKVSVPVNIEESPKPTKKARLANTKSFRSLGDALCLQDSSTVPQSPIGASTSFFIKDQRQDSLQFQLGCVSSGADITSATNIAFPYLPATVSSGSCHTKMSRVTSDLEQVTQEEDGSAKESYGWFVEMDDADFTVASADPYAPAKDLAFSAHTAPKADNHDAEVEWAKAADTVDDVLGDFF